MDTLASECSSGCESGWTLYLDRSLNTSQSHTPSLGCYEETKHKKAQNIEDSDEEDLSMVSDASSGPPHLPYDDDVYFNEKDNVVKKHKKGTKKQKVRENKQHAIAVEDQQHLPSFLHDTASSHVFDFSTVRNMVDYLILIS